MEAIQGTRNSSPIAGLFVAAVAAALLAGATGGYLVRALTSQASVPAPAVVHGSVTTSAASMVGENARQDAPAIESTQPSLVGENGQAAHQDQLPAWLQRYLTPDQAPRFKVDEYIADLK